MRKLWPILRPVLLLLAVAFVASASARQTEKAAQQLDYVLVPWGKKLPDDIKFKSVTASAIDSKDNVYILHRAKPAVLVFDRDGNYLRSWHGDFKGPHGLHIDKDDNVWVVDYQNHTLQKFTPEGKPLMTLGKKDQPGLAHDQFNKPSGIYVAKDNGDLYVSDGYGNSRVVRFDKNGKFIQDWGKKGKGQGEFNLVHGVIIDGNNRVVVSDRKNFRVQVFDRDGKFLEEWKDTGEVVSVGFYKDHFFCADGGKGMKGMLRILDMHGKVLTRWEACAANPEQDPHWLDLDRNGNIFLSFVAGDKIQKWSPR